MSITENRTTTGSDEALKRVRIVVANQMIARALQAIAEFHGWKRVTNGSFEHVLVTDRLPDPDGIQHDTLVVLVADRTPWSARQALDAVANHQADAVVRSDAPEDLPQALSLLAVGTTSIPFGLTEAAESMPPLTTRQIQILQGVRSGQCNADIARALHLSLASVKRELTVLYDVLDVASRSTLSARAGRLGISDDDAAS